MPDLMRTSLLHTLAPLLRVSQHKLAKVPARKLRSYLVAVLARAGDYPDSRRMQSTVRRRQHRAPPRAIRTLLLPSQREALLCDSL